MAKRPRISTERLYKGIAKKERISPGRRRFLKLLVVGTAAAAAHPITKGVMGFFKKRRLEHVNKEHAFLNSHNFGDPALRREWARISLEFEEHLVRNERQKKLDYLRMVERILPKTKDLTPIDVVRTIRLNEPTRENAFLIRNKIENEKKRLSSEPIYSKQPRLKAERESEIKRLENVAAICESVAEMGAQGKAFAGAIDRVPRDVWDDILKDRKAGKL